jgi:regulator of sigma E protease
VFGLPAWLLIFPVIIFLIFIHELGHFAMAKWFGIKVTEFGFGFPPRIWGVSYRGTVYSINWIPLGGFVRMVGEEDPTDPQSFARQRISKRVAVLVAGSFMNLALPVVIFTVLFMLPHDALLGGDVVIAGVVPGSPAGQAGLRTGDTILSIDGERVSDPRELVNRINASRGRPTEMTIRRGAVVSGLSFSPDLMTVETVMLVPRVDDPRRQKVVEVVTDPETQISLADARKYDRSMKVGDTLVQRAIGVSIGLINPKFGKEADPIWRAAPKSIATMWGILDLTWNAIAEGVSTGSNPGIVGPIGIAQATGEGVSRLGFSWIFQLMAFLSLNLGIVNLLPIPALDGGRLMFVGIEWVRRGRRISPQREGLVHLIGFAIVIGFILVVSYSDVVRIFSGESLF